MRRRLLGLLPLALMIGCSHVRMMAPDGFAPLPDRQAFRAVSPEGVRFRVRTVENEPEQSLEFWSKALRSHLEKEGYPSSGEPTRFTAGEQDGMAFEWVMPYANETWSYLTAIVVSEVASTSPRRPGSISSIRATVRLSWTV